MHHDLGLAFDNRNLSQNPAMDQYQTLRNSLLSQDPFKGQSPYYDHTQTIVLGNLFDSPNHCVILDAPFSHADFFPHNPTDHQSALFCCETLNRMYESLSI